MFSKRARYALHGVGFLAYNYSEVPVAFPQILAYLKEYSRNLSLSPGYIKKIFQDLSRAGVVRAMVGRKGGYALARPPKALKMIDVVGAIDGYPVDECCLLSVGGCNREDDCGVNSLIREAQGQFYNFLSKETADSLAKKVFGKKGPRGVPRRGGKKAASRTGGPRAGRAGSRRR